MSIINIPMIAIRFLLPCVDVNIVFVSVVFVLHIPMATVSLLLSNVDFKTMTPGTVVSIGNPSRTTMYGNIAAAWSCNEIWNTLLHLSWPYVPSTTRRRHPAYQTSVNKPCLNNGGTCASCVSTHPCPSTEDWQAIPQLYTFSFQRFSVKYIPK